MAQQPDIQPSSQRRSERAAWKAEVHFRSGNKRANVRLCDISPLGARVQGVFLVHQGDRFFIKLEGMESMEAQVAWVTDFEFGCEFLHPLNPLVLESKLAG